MMIQKSKLALIILLTFLCVACNQKPDALASNGEAIFLKNYQDKWLVLNYWATWCKPCFEEIPAFNQFYQHHQDRVMILGISFDDLTHDQINAFKEQLHISYPLLITNLGPIFGINEIPHLPATFIISPDRKKVVALYGKQTEATLLEIINKGEA